MRVGVPREVKTGETRVAMTPDGVRELVAHYQEVIVERGAGEGSALRDDDYAAAGAVLGSTDDAWAADMVVKVKEPQADELARLRPGLTLFTYLHLAAYPDVGRALLDAGVTALAYETVQLADGALPLLAPMSEVAGRMATQIGAHYLERENGGRGVLLGGAPGVRPARVVVLGAGNVGWNAAWIAQGMEAEVLLLDKNLDRLRWVDQIHRGRIMTLASNRGAVERAVAEADLVIGAVLVAGGRAPTVVTEAMVAAMKRGAVIVDVAVDQGGCVATTRETTHDDPIYVVHDVIHYAVGNMPGAVPYTSTYALTNATLSYVLEVAEHGVAEAARRDDALRHGVNAVGGRVTNPAVAEALGVDCVDPLTALDADPVAQDEGRCRSRPRSSWRGWRCDAPPTPLPPTGATSAPTRRSSTSTTSR
ncbi:MAG: alanine dehydrogenase [Actinobacteria bacterium]|nr:alanine dehydrogenase [Actinomycetota bacterium]